MAQSAYIHIPFCKSKCDFCDFAVVIGLADRVGEYCSTVAREIHARLPGSASPQKLATVYYGGGTPGYIDPKSLAVIHEALSRTCGFEDSVEVTLETTPACLIAEKASAWRDLGINRLSIGVESLTDAELVAMGRGETRKEALSAFETAVKAGFDNICLDLMYGLPTQTLDSWQSTLAEAMQLPVKHISAYGLALAHGSPLYSRYEKGSPSYPCEETFARMYEILVEVLASHGFVQYEISNFSRPGYQSRHNLNYWKNEEYLAFGLSAHRYVGGVRSANFRSFARYMKDPLASEMEEAIDSNTRLKEGIFLALRTREGIDLAYFRSRYGVDICHEYQEAIDRLSAGGFLYIEEGWLRLTSAGVLVSNLVLSEFV